MAGPQETWRPRLATKARLQWDTIEQQHMLMFPEAALKLNATAAEVLKLCDGQRTVAQIVDALLKKFSTADRQVVEGNVRQLLTRIRRRGLLEN